jgi:hypothetical protein
MSAIYMSKEVIIAESISTSIKVMETAEDANPGDTTM